MDLADCTIRFHNVRMRGCSPWRNYMSLSVCEPPLYRDPVHDPSSQCQTFRCRSMLHRGLMALSTRGLSPCEASPSLLRSDEVRAFVLRLACHGFNTQPCHEVYWLGLNGRSKSWHVNAILSPKDDTGQLPLRSMRRATPLRSQGMT